MCIAPRYLEQALRVMLTHVLVWCLLQAYGNKGVGEIPPNATLQVQSGSCLQLVWHLCEICDVKHLIIYNFKLQES